MAAVLAWLGGLGWTQALWAVPLAVGLWVLLARWLAGRRAESDAELARLVETSDSALDARLLTAVSVLDKPRRDGEEPAYLERRVIEEALEHGDAQAWVEAVTGRQARGALRWAVAALYLFVGAMLWLAASLRHDLLPGRDDKVAEAAGEKAADTPPPPGAPLVFEVKPGDTEVELDSRLVVEA